MDGSVAEGNSTEVQSLTDIQSYLASFNKEISVVGSTAQGYVLATGDSGLVGLAGGEHLYAAEAGITVDQNNVSAVKMEGVQDGSALLGSGPEAPTIIGMTPVQPSGPGQNLFTIQPETSQGVQVLNPAASGEGSLIPSQHLMENIASQSSVIPTAVSAQTETNDNQSGQIVSLPSDGANQITTPSITSPATIPGGQTLATTKEGSAPSTSGEQDSVVVSSGNSYQTVTIVPSEVNPSGEVSYVLIVSQGEGEDEKNSVEEIDMSVYDFKEEKGMGQSLELEMEEAGEGEDGPPHKIIKFTPKKVSTPMQSQLMCNYCNYTSPKRYLLTRHMKSHSEERPHKCTICNRGFKTTPSLQNHVNTHTGVRPHKCKECDAAFTTSGELVRHVRYRHTFEKPHRCTECDYASVELSKLKRHLRSHTGERPYQCPHCSYASPDTYKLKRHLRIHTGEKPYECDICLSRFTQSNSLKAHKLIHSGNKPVFQCELCPTTCGRRTDLKIHVQKLHTSDRPLQCKKCGKSFPDRYTYKIHVKTHEGEKCFKCELCPYSAHSQRHLESHMLTHTGEKPFKCEECDLTFRQKQLLRRHKNLYHTPDYVPPEPRDKVHECSECSKTFVHRGNLLRHLMTHDPENVELQEAINNHMMETGEEEEEEPELKSEDLEEGEMIATQGHLLGTGPDGIQLAEVNGQQVQVQLVSVGGEDGQQVYIQIGGADITAHEGAAQALSAVLQREEEEEDPVGNLTQQQQHSQQQQQAGTSQVNQGEVMSIEKAGQDGDTSGVQTIILDPVTAASLQASLVGPGQDDSASAKGSEAVKDEEQKQKDIDTCFGFDLQNDR